MNRPLFDLLSLALLTVFLTGMRFVRAPELRNEDYLSVDTGYVLRGFFSISVVFHHLAQRSPIGWIFPLFVHVGYLCVSVFFFFSGYGLQKSYMTGASYEKKFLQRRLLKVLIPYAGITVLYWLFYAQAGTILSLKDIGLAILKDDPIVSFSWFIISISSFYIAFWLIIKLCKKDYLQMVVWACIWFIGYVILCRKLGFGRWWINTPHLLIFGMVWAIFENRIIRQIEKHYLLIGLLTAMGFIIVIIGQKLSTSVILEMVSAVMFVLLVILFVFKVRLTSRILRFMGRISLEIYLIQGLLMLVLRSNLVYIENEFVWAAGVTGGSVLLGWLLNRCFTLVYSAIASGVSSKMKK